MRLGFLVETIAPIDVSPYTTIEQGETGKVVSVDKATGETVILLDRFHAGLTEWHNTIALISPYTDEWLPKLSFAPHMLTLPNVLARPQSYFFAALLVCVTAWLGTWDADMGAVYVTITYVAVSCGTLPALFASTLASLWYAWVLPPGYSIYVDEPQKLLLFMCAAAGIALLTGRTVVKQ